MKNTINIFLIIGGLNGHGAWYHNRPLKKTQIIAIPRHNMRVTVVITTHYNKLY